MRIESQNKPGFFFWACSTGKKKKDNCPILLDDQGKPGKPMIDPDAPKADCPPKSCKKQVTKIQSTQNPEFWYWRCENPKHGPYYDEDGQPGKKMKFKKK